MFDSQVVKGWVEGRQILQKVLWISDGRLGTEDEVFLLGKNEEWDWINDFTQEERRSEYTKMKKVINSY